MLNPCGKFEVWSRKILWQQFSCCRHTIPVQGLILIFFLALSYRDLDSRLNSRLDSRDMSPCILSICVCLLFVLHFQLVLWLQKLPAVSFSPCLITLKIAGITNKVLLITVAGTVPLILPVTYVVLIMRFYMKKCMLTFSFHTHVLSRESLASEGR